MKAIIVSMLLAASTNALAAEVLCGVEVESCHIFQKSPALSINGIRASFNVDNAQIKECFNENGVVIVGIYPNGDTRAIQIK